MSIVPFPGKPKKDERSEDFYYRLDLLDGERAQLIKILRGNLRTAIVKVLLERVELAEKVPLPYTERYPWDTAEEWERRGYRLVDQIADGFRPKGAPGPPVPPDEVA